jgi:hypothetical protein
MNKKEKETLANAALANAVTEKDIKGHEFLDSFTVENIFEEVKHIVRKRIPKDMIPYMDDCKYHSIVFYENRICQICFAFGNVMNGYEVTLNAHWLSITPRYPDVFKKSLCCYTCDLTKE